MKLSILILPTGNEHKFLFGVFYQIFSSYLVVDTLWILLIPQAVPSGPCAIAVHHLATLFYMIIPFIDSQFSWHMAVCLLVEMNSLFLTLRRNIEKDTLLHKICETLFLFSWVVLRVFMYPILLVFMWKEYDRYTLEKNSRWNMMVFAPIFQFILTAMSLKWTYDLYMKLFHSSKKYQHVD